MKIIQSVLDTDLYKFSMSYAYMKLFPEAQGTFEFTDRSKREYDENFLVKLRSALDELSKLSLQADEFEWAVRVLGRYIPQHYWEWLKGFRFDSSKVFTRLDEKRQLKIRVIDHLYKSSLYEVSVLAIVSELCNQELPPVDSQSMVSRLFDKIELANEEGLYFSEFGTRRRFSFAVQDEVVKILSEESKTLTGTSNCYLAMKYNLTPIGTVAHEWTMFHAALYGYRQANYLALENWVNCYDGDLGIALTDTFTSKVFFDNFSRKQAKLFDGLRHDSGDPIEYVNRAIARYKELGVDYKSKTIVFSNALTMSEFKRIKEYCDEVGIRAVAGIGTNLSNDTGNKPTNIVMKLTLARISPRKSWVSCIKVSDDVGKHLGASSELELCYNTLGIEK